MHRSLAGAMTENRGSGAGVGGGSARAKFRRRAAGREDEAERARPDGRTEEPEDPFVGQDGRPTAASIPPSRPPD